MERLNAANVKRRAIEKFPAQIQDHQNATDSGSKFYIAAEFNASDLPGEFVVGDGKTYSGYYNAPLLPGTVYKVHLRAVAKDQNGVNHLS